MVLVDAQGRLLASSPDAGPAVTLAQANPALAAALRHGTFGPVPHEAKPSTFAAAAVPGTGWRLAIDVPDSKLYESIGGLGEIVPWLVFALVSLLGALLLALFARSLADRARLLQLSATLEGIARTDPLTGLLNRRGIDEDVARTWARARRRKQALTALMIDLDRFKEVNDRYGHEAGDRVLAVADCMRVALRQEDVYGRLGGDEFVVLLDADEAAERLRAAAAARRCPRSASTEDPRSASASPPVCTRLPTT